MLLIDIFLRLPNLTLCIVLIALMARDGRKYYQAWLAIGLLITSIASSLHTLPSALALPNPIYNIALIISVPSLAAQWWFARSVLEERFRPNLIDWLIMAIACFFKLGWSLQGMGILVPAHGFRYFGSYATHLVITAHIIWIAVQGLKTDLVEPRRRVRYWFIFFMALTSITNIVMELQGYSGDIEAIFIHGTTLPMLFWAVLWLSKFSPEKIFFDADATATKPESQTARTDPADAPLPERMGLALQKLTQVIEIEQHYKDNDLTIGKLARLVGVPEHQLRKLINQSLGYRNFATYLNSYRIDYAKAALSDPNEAQTPILTIAMDAGYKTLSTFNRAFRATENEAPSDYRKRTLRSAIDNHDAAKSKTAHAIVK